MKRGMTSVSTKVDRGGEGSYARQYCLMKDNIVNIVWCMYCLMWDNTLYTTSPHARAHTSFTDASISDTTTKCGGALHFTEVWQYSASNVTMPSNMWKELSHILINLLPSLCACTFRQETVRWIPWAYSKKLIRSNEIARSLIITWYLIL